MTVKPMMMIDLYGHDETEVPDGNQRCTGQDGSGWAEARWGKL